MRTLFVIAAAVIAIGATACAPPGSPTGSAVPGCYNNTIFNRSVNFNGGFSVYNSQFYESLDCQGSIEDYWHLIESANQIEAQIDCADLGFSGLLAINMFNDGYEAFPGTTWRCVDLI